MLCKLLQPFSMIVAKILDAKIGVGWGSADPKS